MKTCCCREVTSVMSDSLQPHRQQPTRFPRPWDSPSKNTGAGCHFLLQCMKVKSEREVAQSCLTLSDPMHCSLPGSSIHGIFQARVLEWGTIDSLQWRHSAAKEKKNSPRETSEVSGEAWHEKGWNQSGSDIMQVMEREATACFHRELGI